MRFARETLDVIDKIQKFFAVAAEAHSRFRKLHVQRYTSATSIVVACACENNQPGSQMESLCGVVGDKDDGRLELDQTERRRR